MSLLAVGSIALDSVATPFGETADAPGGSAVFFSAAGAILHPVQMVGWWERLSPGRPERARGSRGRYVGIEQVAGESFRWRAKHSYDLSSVKRGNRLGVSPIPSQAPGEVSRRALSVPRQHRSRAAAQRPGPGHPPGAGRVRHDELLDPIEARPAPRAAASHRHPHDQRLRGARALGRLEHLSRRAVGAGPRPPHGGLEAGRAWRAAGRPLDDVQGAGVSAPGGVRSHRRGRCIRGGIHGLSGVHRRCVGSQPPPRDGVRRHAGLVRRGGIWREGSRCDAGRRAGGVRAFKELVHFDMDEDHGG